MPRNADLNALSRQWELLKILPNRAPGLTSRDILERLQALGYNVTKRTVERDLQDLSRPFPIQCNDKGKPFGWYWTPGANAELPGISLAEALSMRLVEDLLKPLLPGAMLNSLQGHFNQAKNKLKALQDENTAARWQDKVRHVPPALPMLPPEIDDNILDTVQQALLYDRQLEVMYQCAHNDTGKTLALHPLGLVQRGPVTYLVATAFAYQDIRLYALHRFSQAILTDVAAQRPDNFNLDDYIASGALQFGDGTQLQLTAKISKGLADYLAETRLADDQTLTPQTDGFILQATVNNSWQLRWWVLSNGAAIEILAPELLREQIYQIHSQACQRYTESSL